MFDGIAFRYDLFNQLASLGLDRLWRARLIRAVLSELKDGGTVLDLGTGTADLIQGLLKTGNGGSLRTVGIDLSHSMLKEARAKLAGENAWLVQGSALSLPFPGGSCDVVMNAFVLRNIRGIMSDALLEIHKVLKPGGKIFFLEMYVPRNRVLIRLHRIYLKTILPLIGRLVFGGSGSQEYLADTIFGFGTPQDFAGRLRSAGFTDVKIRAFSGGIAVLHSAAKKL